MDMLHVLAMSVWVGGLLVLIAVLPVATRALEPPDRTRLLAAVAAPVLAGRVRAPYA